MLSSLSCTLHVLFVCKMYRAQVFLCVSTVVHTGGMPPTLTGLYSAHNSGVCRGNQCVWYTTSDPLPLAVWFWLTKCSLARGYGNNSYDCLLVIGLCFKWLVHDPGDACCQHTGEDGTVMHQSTTLYWLDWFSRGIGSFIKHFGSLFLSAIMCFAL